MVTVEPANEGDLCSSPSAERRRCLRGARLLVSGWTRAVAGLWHPRVTQMTPAPPSRFLWTLVRKNPHQSRGVESLQQQGGGDKRQSTSHPRWWGRGCRVRCQGFGDGDGDWAGESRGGGKSGPEEEVRAASSAA